MKDESQQTFQERNRSRGCQAEPWGRDEGKGTWAVGTAGGGYQQPFMCEPESFLNSALAPSLPLRLPSASHHLFIAPQMWSSEVNSCEENGGGERISRVLLTDGLRGNILALRRRDEKSVLAYNCVGQKFHEFFIIRWYRNTRMNFLANPIATEPIKFLDCRGTPSNLFIGYKIKLLNQHSH